MIHTDPLTVVWQVDRHNRDTCWEDDWITELLQGADLAFTIIDDGTFEVCIDNALVVIGDSPHNSAYFQKLDAMNYRYSVMVIRDEFYKFPTDCYEHAQFVFRNYWHKKFAAQKNVYFFPLGYKHGFWNHRSTRDLKKADKRAYIWSFAGQISFKPTRDEMIEAMKRIPHHYIHTTAAWADAHSLPVDRYQNMLLNSIFVPCPMGFWNLDSFRIYEALECGCIPIVERHPLDYFKHYFGEHPFVTIDTWDQVPDIINKLIADPVELERYRAACHQWWLDYKAKISQQLATVLKDA